MKELSFTFVAPFGGSGLGARGFLDAERTLPGLGVRARWECLGGVDIDPLACADFEYLTGAKQLCADVAALKPEDARRAWGAKAPDCVFTSAPCQGSSALISARKAATPKYATMNELALVWTRLMLATWDEPPALMLFENVPGVPTRAPEMLRELTRLLRRAGYVLTHSTHDAGELGGLAQHRRRWLLVARLPRRCPPVLYQPPLRRVRGCGEVLEQLPVPGTTAAEAWGPMHALPRASWRNWLRLAAIPAGGDWRDLDGVLGAGQPRREVFRRHRVEHWDGATGTITADAGSNGVGAVADPRAKAWFGGVLGVLPWDEPAGVVTASAAPTRGAFSVADLRVTSAFDAGYSVLRWDQAARTIATKTAPGSGAYAVADARPERPEPRIYSVPDDLDEVPNPAPVILARDGTWHRPLTTLELAALQGFPLRVNGAPLRLAGGITHQRRSIGNAVPAPAARAIGEQMLLALTEAALGGFSLSSDPVWVSPEAHA